MKPVETMTASELLEAMQSNDAGATAEEIACVLRYVGKMQMFVTKAVTQLKDQAIELEHYEGRITRLEAELASIKG